MSTEGTGSSDSEEVVGDEFGPNIDDCALANAARRSRLPFDRPTEHELAFFPELWDSKSAVEVFLLIRNTTLATWQTNMWKECTALDVRGNVFPPFNSDLDLIQNIVHYLTRHGLINFGRYTRATKINRFLLRDQRSVIVIGAGAAGISAATQLISFGFDVTILEARGRIGGRCQNLLTENGDIMELGADTLRSLFDSPMRTLLSQVNMEQHDAYDNNMLFSEGKPVDKQKDQVICGLYISARGALNWQAHQREHRDETGRFISRQQAYENVFTMMERGTHIKYFNHCKSMEEIAAAREHHFKHMRQLRNTALMADQRLKQLEAVEGTEDDDSLLRRSLKRDIVTALSKFDEVADAFETVDNHLHRLHKNPASKQYMHPTDYRMFNFLLGFEEYSYGAPLEQVQFSCDAEQNKSHGCCTRLTEGVASLFNQIAEKRNLDIRLRHRVRNIDYSEKDQVTVTVERADGMMEKMRAAFVVCTMPIGVLKKTIQNDPRAATFTPELPEDKKEAIKCMGSGLVNKCILVFERPFWEAGQRYQFVDISSDIKTRGSMLVWSAVPGSNAITTYIVGEAALHSLPDEVIIHKAMASLIKIFGHNCPKHPVSAHVTRWQNDEFAFGSGAYMSLRTEMRHFDALMKPLSAPLNDDVTETTKPRVYFAGEHTCATYTATVQGAWMSGARAAADLANEHIGVGFVDLSGEMETAETTETTENVVQKAPELEKTTEITAEDTVKPEEIVESAESKAENPPELEPVHSHNDQNEPLEPQKLEKSEKSIELE